MRFGGYCCNAVGPLVAQSGHYDCAEPCPLLGVKRTSHFLDRMSAFDPKRTLASSRKGRFLDRPYERTVNPFTFSGSDFETGPSCAW
jgi:hypothetical protein